MWKFEDISTKKNNGQQFFFKCCHISAILLPLNIFKEKNNLEKIFQDNVEGILHNNLERHLQKLFIRNYIPKQFKKNISE
jgi:hypothetical protein